jgi:hypothetical protein
MTEKAEKLREADDHTLSERIVTLLRAAGVEPEYTSP